MHKPQFSKKNKNKIAYLGACSKNKNYVPNVTPTLPSNPNFWYDFKIALKFEGFMEKKKKKD